MSASTTVSKLSIVIALAVSATAQQVTFRVVDGRNGRAFRKKATILIWFGTTATGVGLPLTTDSSGLAVLNLKPEYRSFLTAVIAQGGVKDCRRGNRPDKVINANVYRFAEVIEHGIAAENSCGKPDVRATPGDFILFVRPLHWWEKYPDW